MSKEEKEKIHYKKYLITLSKDKINNSDFVEISYGDTILEDIFVTIDEAKNFIDKKLIMFPQ